MGAIAMEQINKLASERSELFQQAANGGNSVTTRMRIRQVTEELDALWTSRRQEKSSQRDAIDLLVDRGYERIYGNNYEEVVRPSAVADEEESAPSIAA